MQPEEGLASQAGGGIVTPLGPRRSPSRRLLSPGMGWGAARFITASIALAWHEQEWRELAW